MFKRESRISGKYVNNAILNINVAGKITIVNIGSNMRFMSNPLSEISLKNNKMTSVVENSAISVIKNN